MGKTDMPRMIICDLDGVVWLAHEEIPGAASAVASLRAAGVQFRFVTNASFDTVDDVETHLRNIGIEARGDVLTSAMSAAFVLEPGSRVLLCGGRGLHDELTKKGCDVTVSHTSRGASGPFDAVVVGLYREFDYEVLKDCMRAVRAGARLIGSNADNTYPTPRGLDPGGGAVLAAISVGAGVDPLITGKPHPPMVELVRSRMGDVSADRVLVVGDKVATDGRFADALGCGFGFVLSGVGNVAEAPAGAFVAADLAGLAAQLLG